MVTPSPGRVAELESEITRLMRVIETMTAEFTAELRKLNEQLARQNERIAELLPAARRGQRPRPDAAPAAPQAPDVPDAPAPSSAPHSSGSEEKSAIQEAFAARPMPPALPERPSKSTVRPSATGRKLLPDSIPAEVRRQRVAACPGCGSTRLDQRGYEREEKLHAALQQIVRRVVERQVCVCRDCNTRTTACSLPAPYQRSKVTGEFLAWVLHQKFDQLVPLDRVRRDLARRGVHIAMSVLVSLVERGADLLARVDGEHWKQLKRGGVMHTDLTGIKVLVPGLSRAYDGYIEGFLHGNIAVFQYEAAKDGAAIVAKLTGYEGRLIADAESRTNAVFANEAIVEAGCNAHGRRKFEAAEGAQPLLAAEGGQFLSAMYVAEAEAKAKQLTGDELHSWRQLHMVPIRDGLLKWMAAVEPTLLPTDPLAKAVRYYSNHRDALFRFIDDPVLPIDNSAMEREFQNWAKLRLNALFAGSTEGAHRAATLFGIASTCRLEDVHMASYLAWAFDRLGTHRDQYNLSAAELTPAAYKRELARTAAERASPAHDTATGGRDKPRRR